MYFESQLSFIKFLYSGQVGDVIVGRVVALENKCWRIDCNSYSNGILQLSYVNLPGGELRRRSEQDERAMREYLAEGDLISVIIQRYFIFSFLRLKFKQFIQMEDYFYIQEI